MSFNSGAAVVNFVADENDHLQVKPDLGRIFKAGACCRPGVPVGCPYDNTIAIGAHQLP
jgi:hypothetical protein